MRGLARLFLRFCFSINLSTSTILYIFSRATLRLFTACRLSLSLCYRSPVTNLLCSHNAQKVVCSYFFLFSFLTIPSIIFALFLCPSPSLDITLTREGSQTGSSPPSPLRHAPSFYRENNSARSSLVDSRQILHTSPRHSCGNIHTRGGR